MRNFILNYSTKFTKKIPNFKGFGRLVNLFNKLILNLGANPITKALMKDGTSMIVDLRSFELFAFYFGEYDRQLINTLKKLISDGSVFIDVGGNIGFYSVAISNFIKKNNFSSRVYTFEPLKSNFDRLEENINLNNLNDYCKCFCMGLSDKKGEAKLTLREDFIAGSNTGNAAITTSKEFDKNFKIEKIYLDTLDDFWSNLSLNKNISIIKIDIEGHEDYFLRGAKNTINKNKPTILMEINKPYYISRGINIEEAFKDAIPTNYVLLRLCNLQKKWIKSSLNECKEIDNILLVHFEKLEVQLNLINSP